MSSSNDEVPFWAWIFIAAGLFAVIMYILALAVFVAILMSLVAAAAMDGGLTVGRVSVSARQGLAFILCGLAGALLVPLFLAFCGLFVGVDIPWKYMFQYVFGGYAGGSLGMTLLALLASGRNEVAQQHYIQSSNPSQLERHFPAPERFRFASWDDEDGGP